MRISDWSSDVCSSDLPKIVKVIEPEELAARTGYSRPHTLHCGPEGIYVSALGAPDGDGPGGVFLMDHESFDVLGRWEMDSGPQHLAYDLWRHIGYDTMNTTEWGPPNTIADGVHPELQIGTQAGRERQDNTCKNSLETVA